ncbi:Hypothetical predicted protein [Mytilus galloprovincialis]|uniref:Ig-like domain-containing protein n=1 Tax=Mytilus galloprovincialis TaxID=29158 RepID=A0A8B6E9K0_MYTGA|nr:Hypothetical predicted protein [Mytilus galloprovincialis]
MKRNGRFVKEDRFGALVYSIIPKKEDHNSTFSCETYTAAGRRRTKNTATLDIRYKPFLSMNYTSERVIEGQSVTLCCSSDSRPPTLEMWWVMKGRLLCRNYDTVVRCHEITNISRVDSGSYKCFAENEVGIVDDEVIITVLFPPNMPEQHINFTETDVPRTLQCLAYGVPATYSYGRWQHISRFGQHIRYLNPSPEGTVTLPTISNKMERYQDNGIYVCTASNRVADSFDNTYQTGKTFVMSNGPPVFVNKIEHKQYGKQGKIFNMKLIVYSTSEIECYNVRSENREITTSMRMTPINSTMVFHGTEVSVETIEIVLSFNTSIKRRRQNYKVTLCNGYSNSSFVIYITSVPVDTEEKKTGERKVEILIFSILVVMCVQIIGAAVYLRRKRKRRISEGVSESESIEGQPVPVENIVYQNATQSVAFLTTPVQTSAEVIEYNRGSYVQERTMAPSTGQLNYADVIFPPSTTQDVVHILGIENRTVYADVTVSGGATSLVDSRNVTSSDEEDFVEIEGLENFADK